MRPMPTKQNNFSKNYGKVPPTDDTGVPPWDTVYVDFFEDTDEASLMFYGSRQSNELSRNKASRLWSSLETSGYHAILYLVESFMITVVSSSDMNSKNSLITTEYCQCQPRSKPKSQQPHKRLHLSMGDMLRISQPFIGECWMDKQKRALQAVSSDIRSTINSTTNHTPGQLAFGRDMIMQAKLLVDWEKNMRNKETVTNRGLVRENKKGIDYDYHVGDYVMIKWDRMEQKWKLNAPYTGPYRLLNIYNNGTVKNKRGVYEENIHIRRLKPYQKEIDKKIEND